MTCARCKADETLIESLIPGEPYGLGLKTEFICAGCAREKMGLPRERPPEKPKKSKKKQIKQKLMF
jgi:hypothetical protein